jgi:hypothetical protein
MKKVRALAGVAAMVPAAAAVMAPVAAHAATANGSADNGTARSGKTVSFGRQANTVTPAFDATRLSPINPGPTWASITRGPAPLWTPSNRVHTRLNNGSGNSVFITCYYSGNTGFGSDPFWDHITMYNKNHSTFAFTGHVADHYANLLGHFPASFGIPHC